MTERPPTSSAPAWDQPKFCRLELFKGCEVVGIEFLDGDEMGGAKASALTSVQSNGADRAEVRDDADGLAFVATPSSLT